MLYIGNEDNSHAATMNKNDTLRTLWATGWLGNIPFPDSVANLTAVYSMNHQVTLAWDSANNVTSYNIYQQGISDKWELIHTVESEQITYVLNGLADGSYSFGVAAEALPGESEMATVSITIPSVINGTTWEGNNDYATAVDLGVITSLIEVIGLQLKTGEIADYYKFEFTATGDTNSYARIDFSNANGDLAIQLFDANLKSVKSMDTVKDYEQLNLNKLAVGSYYLKITGYRNAVNAYSLSINPAVAQDSP
jgi:hypothetical protein